MRVNLVANGRIVATARAGKLPCTVEFPALPLDSGFVATHVWTKQHGMVPLDSPVSMKASKLKGATVTPRINLR